MTLHLAATFFIGDVPSQRAAYAAPVPAAVSILLQQYGRGTSSASTPRCWSASPSRPRSSPTCSP
ncbi:DUF7473 family protein [Halosegnis marinus]|uniref:DUF7473 family protein n=1 Tax=Halosegnis marinus TaxID=3034023 RepID=UPI003606E7A9